MYYLNVMAGPGQTRAWLICDDPAHAWVRGTWAGQPVDPGCLMGVAPDVSPRRPLPSLRPRSPLPSSAPTGGAQGAAHGRPPACAQRKREGVRWRASGCCGGCARLRPVPSAPTRAGDTCRRDREAFLQPVPPADRVVRGTTPGLDRPLLGRLLLVGRPELDPVAPLAHHGGQVLDDAGVIQQHGLTDGTHDDIDAIAHVAVHRVVRRQRRCLQPPRVASRAAATADRCVRHGRLLRLGASGCRSGMCRSNGGPGQPFVVSGSLIVCADKVTSSRKLGTP